MKQVKILLTIVLFPAIAVPLAALAPSSKQEPGTPVATVEIRDFATRWSEIRDVPAIAEFQDRLIEAGGLRATEIPGLVGDRTTVSFVPGDDGRSLVPVARLTPKNLEEAEALLRDACRAQDETKRCVVENTGSSILVGPAGSAEQVAELARRDGLERNDEIEGRLPDGGLVRGRLDPDAIRDFLRRQVPETLPSPLDLLRSLLAVELDFVRYAEFRRDLTEDGIVTDAVIGYDTDALPPEIARVFDSATAPRVLPSPLPENVVLASSFDPQAEAMLAWIRHVGRSDTRGPLRNLDFWIDEFEERTGHAIDADLIGLLGKQAWLFLVESDDANHPQAVLIVETSEPQRVERTLHDLHSFTLEQLRGKSLGLLPLRAMDLPSFDVVGDHLILGTGAAAVETGADILASKYTWKPVATAHEAMYLRGPGLARLLDRLFADESRVTAALTGLVGDLDSVSALCRYEGDAVRMTGLARFSDSTPRPSAGRLAPPPPKKTTVKPKVVEILHATSR